MEFRGRHLNLVLSKNPAGFNETLRTAVDLAEGNELPHRPQRPQGRRHRRLVDLGRRLRAARRARRKVGRPGGQRAPTTWRSGSSTPASSADAAADRSRPARSTRSSRHTARATTAHLLCTYTAMLDLRAELVQARLGEAILGNLSERQKQEAIHGRLAVPRPDEHLRRPRQHPHAAQARGVARLRRALARARARRQRSRWTTSTSSSSAAARTASRRSSTTTCSSSSKPPLERAVDNGRSRAGGLRRLPAARPLLPDRRRRALPGIGLIDVQHRGRQEALHRRRGRRRRDRGPRRRSTLVGFENHSGRTFLGPRAKPLGQGAGWASATTAATGPKAACRAASSAPTCTARCCRRTRTWRTHLIAERAQSTRRRRAFAARRLGGAGRARADSAAGASDGSHASRTGPVGRAVRARPAPARRRRQGLAQHLVDRLDQHELHLIAQVGGNVVQVGLVARRQQHAPDARAVRAEHLLLDAADRQHPAAQRDLAGHRDVVAHRPPGEDRGHRGQHRHAG